MKKIIDWFYEPIPDLENNLRFIAGAAVFMMSEMIIAVACLLALGVDISDSGQGSILWEVFLSRQNFVISASDIVIWAGFEEFFFRLIPFLFYMELAYKLCPSVTPERLFRGLIVISIVTSMVFGVMHGAYYKIAIQGVGGLILCVVFLKCGAIRKDFFVGLLSATAAHTLYNAALYVANYFSTRLF